MSGPQPTTLALVAHDRYKEVLADFVFEHQRELRRFHLVATLGTGRAIARQSGLRVNLLASGPDGASQIGELVETNEVQAVIFFRDPVLAKPHEPDIKQLLDVCDARDIPVATNRASAEALLYFLVNSPNRGAVLARPWGYVYAQSCADRSQISSIPGTMEVGAYGGGGNVI